MTKKQKKEFSRCLFEFVQRASAPGATDQEVTALPAVAELLARIEIFEH